MRLDHINIRTDDVDAVSDTLVRLLGLEVGERPPFTRQGVWLYGEDYPIVHISKDEGTPAAGTGALNHIAFRGDDYDGLIARLGEDGTDYQDQVVPNTGVRQVFFRMTHDIMVEVDFDPAS